MKLALQQPGAREIKVKLLLAGGQSATLVVPPEHPLLAQLLATIAAKGDVQQSGVFQIPMEGGRTSLAFAAHQLVGVITDPAVLMQSDAAECGGESCARIRFGGRGRGGGGERRAGARRPGPASDRATGRFLERG